MEKNTPSSSRPRITLSAIKYISLLFLPIFAYPVNAVAEHENYKMYRTPSNEKLSKTPPVLIDFRGIPLGKPGIKGLLQIVCLEKEQNKNCANISGSSFIDMDYGPITNIQALALLSTEGHLLSVALTFKESEARELSRAIVLKYGEAAFKENTAYWRDSKGNLMTLKSNNSFFTLDIQSWNWIQAQEQGGRAIERKRKEQDNLAKDKL